MSAVYAQGYVEPTDTTVADLSKWTTQTSAIQLRWGSRDVHYDRHSYPTTSLSADTALQAWRGERLGLQAVLTTVEPVAGLRVVLEPLRDAAGRTVPSETTSEAGWVRYVLTDDYRRCGYHPDTLPAFTVPDMIDLADAAIDVDANTTRPIWASVEIDPQTAPGRYTSALTIQDSKGATLAQLPFEVEVLDAALPSGADIQFHLNLWQQPYSVSRYYGVEPWSDEHFRLLEPYARRLARAGQKTISAILFYEPWGEQSRDKFEPMVETVRHADGSWSYDYTVFDRWVEFMDSCGVGPLIECYTMIPWEMKFRYRDAATGEYGYVQARTDAPEYRDLWGNFLSAFARHLEEKGWRDRAVITMDERGMRDILNALDVAQSAAPGLKMALHGSYHKELVDTLFSYTLTLGQEVFPADELARRRADGKISCLYTCCSSPRPNIFSNSDPADGAFLPVYCTATGHDGYLHWSFMNWTDRPMEDTRFFMFAPGDTYFIYPDGRSSVRYERMLEGIQLSEKIRLLGERFMAEGDMERYAALQDAMNEIRAGITTRDVTTADIVGRLTATVNALSR